jgi:hypothetical protein
VGLLGAVAMPHNLFLQSALVLSRKVRPERRSVEYACLYMTIETASSLFISFVVNGSVLLVAAASFAPHWCGPKQMVCQGGVDVCDASGPDADCFSVGLETASTLLQRTVGAKVPATAPLGAGPRVRPAPAPARGVLHAAAQRLCESASARDHGVSD